MREQFVEAESFLKNFFAADVKVVHVEKIIAVLFEVNLFGLRELRRIFYRGQIKFGVAFVVFERIFCVADVPINFSERVVNEHLG